MKASNATFFSMATMVEHNFPWVVNLIFENLCDRKMSFVKENTLVEHLGGKQVGAAWPAAVEINVFLNMMESTAKFHLIVNNALGYFLFDSASFFKFNLYCKNRTIQSMTFS